MFELKASAKLLIFSDRAAGERILFLFLNNFHTQFDDLSTKEFTSYHDLTLSPIVKCI